MWLLTILLVVVASAHLTAIAEQSTSTTTTSPINRLKLRGVYGSYPPYVYRNVTNGPYKGFSLDVIKAIAERAGFDYTLHYNPAPLKSYWGLVESVYLKEADFVIGNIDDRDDFKPYVDFTHALFNDQRMFAAVSNKLSQDICRLSDLFGQKPINYTFGSFDAFRLLDIIEHNTHPIVSTINSSIWNNFNFERNLDRAVERLVADPNYVLIVEQYICEFLSDCGVDCLPDTDFLLPRSVVIPLAKRSPYTDMFNRAIDELKSDGTMLKIRNKYTSSVCLKGRTCSLALIPNPI